MNDTDKLHYVHTNLYSAKAKEIMNSVFGQLSDGWGENNPRNDRYWMFGNVRTADNGEILIEIEKIGSKRYCDKYIENGFHVFRDNSFGLMSDDEIKQWMARLIKKTAQMELRDNGGKSGTWKRDNENKCVYLGHYDEKYGPVVTFADTYLVYEHLLGRNYSGKYTTGKLEEILGQRRSEAETSMEETRRTVEAERLAKIEELNKQHNAEFQAKVTELNEKMNIELKAKIEALNKEYDEKISNLTIATAEVENVA